jgi:hypothetical protein
MKAAKVLVVLCLFLAAHVAASGATGVFAVVENVVFEPSEANPERIQLWGAFAFTDGQIGAFRGTTNPFRGYLYFSMPEGSAEQARLVRNEWADLKAIAGTGQAVAFGRWTYIGEFGPSGPSLGTCVGVQVGERNVLCLPLAVQTQLPPAMDSTPYITNTGLVKLTAEGSHAEIVKQLRAALAAK